MKAKHFKKLRATTKWYRVSYRDTLIYDFSNEKKVLAKSAKHACYRYYKRTGCFINSRSGDVSQMPGQLSRFKVVIGKKIMYFD